MRIIDADSLVRNIKKWEKYIGNYEKEIPYNEDIYVSTMLTIEDEPTVDAVPIKHGRWVGNERHTSCSICGQTYCVPDGQDGHLDMTFYKYCPNCGADMRTKETDCDYERAIEQLEHDMIYEPTFNKDDGSM